MPNPISLNPDGTRQVVPPQISAFSQQASASAPPPPPSPQAQDAAAHPGFGEAIMQMLSQLTQLLNPKVPRAPRATEQAIEAQSNGQPAPQGLGGQFHPGQ